MWTGFFLFWSWTPLLSVISHNENTQGKTIFFLSKSNNTSPFSSTHNSVWIWKIAQVVYAINTQLWFGPNCFSVLPGYSKQPNIANLNKIQTFSVSMLNNGTNWTVSLLLPTSQPFRNQAVGGSPSCLLEIFDHLLSKISHSIFLQMAVNQPIPPQK